VQNAQVPGSKIETLIEMMLEMMKDMNVRLFYRTGRTCDNAICQEEELFYTYQKLQGTGHN
jgi:hypothetical protein